MQPKVKTKCEMCTFGPEQGLVLKQTTFLGAGEDGRSKTMTLCGPCRATALAACHPENLSRMGKQADDAQQQGFTKESEGQQ